MTTYDRKMIELAGRVATAEGRAVGLQDELDLTRRTAAEQHAAAMEQIEELKAENRHLRRDLETAEAKLDELEGVAPRSDYDAGRRRARLIGAQR